MLEYFPFYRKNEGKFKESYSKHLDSTEKNNFPSGDGKDNRQATKSFFFFFFYQREQGLWKSL